MAKAGHENFPVALWLLPADCRRHLLAFYGFARLVDDIGDDYDGDRLAALSALEHDVQRMYLHRPRHPLLKPLQQSVRELGVPKRLLLTLIEANRQDQHVTRYDTFDDLLGYCRLSANPIGHLVLHAFQAATPVRIGLADRICSALQIIEHLQDVAEDYARGRVYLPQEDLSRFGCAEDDLARPAAGGRLRHLIAFECERADRLLQAGRPLINTMPRRKAAAIAGYIAGGYAALAAIRRAGYDVLAHPTSPTRLDLARAFIHTWSRRRE
ncbi:squalene synthase HpnC [Nonomuraea sp. NPDC005650]|uniref:squalene synthase HpnC n=1 Tax=Nonomuraea sp. NPDC005650 TaxID=3157045 RepID=UPI0033A7341C